MTGAVIMVLMDKGLLDVNDPVIKYTKGLFTCDSKDYEKKVTIQMALTHTTGLKVLDPRKEPWVGNTGKGAFQEWMKDNQNLSFDEEPPGPVKYNNVGYVPLGLIIENITGKSFNQAVKEYVFKPRRMTTATFDSKITTTVIDHYFFDKD